MFVSRSIGKNMGRKGLSRLLIFPDDCAGTFGKIAPRPKAIWPKLRWFAMRSLLPRYGFKELTAFSMKLDTSASAILLPVSRARARCTTAASWGRFKKGTYDSGGAQSNKSDGC